MGFLFLLLFTLFLYVSLPTHKTRTIGVILTCGLYYLLRNDPVIFINIMTVICLIIGVIKSFVNSNPKLLALNVCFVTTVTLMKGHAFPIDDPKTLAAQVQLESSEKSKNSDIQPILAGNNSKASKTQDKSQPVKGNQ